MLLPQPGGCSSRMLMHKATHSSQIRVPGPVMIFALRCWVFRRTNRRRQALPCPRRRRHSRRARLPARRRGLALLWRADGGRRRSHLRSCPERWRRRLTFALPGQTAATSPGGRGGSGSSWIATRTGAASCPRAVGASGRGRRRRPGGSRGERSLAASPNWRSRPVNRYVRAS
jgi:hypothetical protein